MSEIRISTRFSSEARALVRGLILVSTCLGIGASGQTATPQAPDPQDPPQNEVKKAISGYSPSMTTIAINYRTKRDPMTGVVTIVKGEASTKTIDINFERPLPDSQPFEAIFVSFQVSYKKAKGKYAITATNAPVKRDGDHYLINLEAFAQKFASDINSTLPPSFDPNTTEFDFKDALEVTITPVGKSDPIITASLNTGEPIRLTKKITITFEPVIGD